MGRWVHRLLEINATDRTGVCAACGPVSLVKRHGRLKCVVARRIERGGNSRKRKAHGLTAAQARTFTSGKTCAICGADDRLVVDHCHRRRKIRDVLCSNCNAALGLFRDDSTRLRLAAAYLDKHSD